METRPIDTLKSRMVLFSESARLMVRVKAVQEDGFTFHVMNGAWDGRMTNGLLNIDIFPEESGYPATFQEVLSVTRDEYGAWYMNAASELIDATPGVAPPQDPAEIRSRIDAIADEHQWEEHALNDHAVGFILGKNLGEEFATYLDTQPLSEVDDDEIDNEISF